jgi:hypothetical protein
MFYLSTFLIGSMFARLWRLLRRREPVTIEEPEDYGTTVAQV